MEIDYVTSNKKKFEEACKIILRSSEEHRLLTLVHTPLHIEEIQASKDEIATHKALLAYAQCKKPVIIDDISLHCPALKGLPGPYIKPFLASLGQQGFFNLLSYYSDRRCEVICTIAFYDGQEPPLLFHGALHGIIVSPRGSITEHGPLSWNSLVQPDGSAKTCAEMTLDELSTISARNKALEKLHSYLKTYIETRGAK